MIKLILLSVFVVLLSSSCAVANSCNEQDYSWQAKVASACVIAHLDIDSPLWDSNTRQPIVDNVKVVKFEFQQGGGRYLVSFVVDPSYPDSPSSWCVVEATTNKILTAAYEAGGYGSNNIAISQASTAEVGKQLEPRTSLSCDIPLAPILDRLEVSKSKR